MLVVSDKLARLHRRRDAAFAKPGNGEIEIDHWKPPKKVLD
jgi:hypothetical protein